MKHLFLVCTLFISVEIVAQAVSTAAHYASTIDSNTLREHVYRLASADFEGRETGMPGNLLAANYIAQHFADDGIPVLPGDDDYFQEVQFSSIRWASMDMTVNGEKVEHLKDFLSIPQYFPVVDNALQVSSMTFLGYGIEDEAWSDYAGKKYTGQHLLVYAGEPRDKNGNFRISGTDSISEWSQNPFLKVVAAKNAGAASIWIIDDQFRDKVMMARKFLLSGSTLMGSPDSLTNMFIPHALLTPALAERMVGAKRNKIIKVRNRITQRGKPGKAVIPVNIQWTPVHNITSTPGMNVLGYIEGTDPVLKNELVVITAHYDHLGKRGSDIYFGADDNASGTSAVLEIAEAMAMAKASGAGPRRSVLCMLVTGEEKGLLGSQYYSEHPIFPLENTVANVNIDMIGRTDGNHANKNYTYVIGADRLSTELHSINEAVNQKYTNLELDYTYNAEDDPNQFYYRSDHYNFAKKGIPAIFYFSGVHDDYHRPTDTPDKLLYGKAMTIAQLAFHTAWELANRDERIKVDVVGKN